MKTPAPKLDMTPVLARQVIDLYASELSDVRFPDLDLAALQGSQSELHAAQLEVEQLEAELARARALLERRSETLSAKAERALAYARIFAQGDAALAPRLADLADLGRNQSGRKKSGALGDGGGGSGGGGGGNDDAARIKRRGRRPKSETPSQLFDQTAAPEAAAAEE